MFRRILAGVLAVVVLLGQVGCSVIPHSDEVTKAIEDVPGVKSATASEGSGRGRASYHVYVRLADDPSADTLSRVFQEFAAGVAGRENKDVSLLVRWFSGEIEREIHWVNTLTPPGDEYVRGAADWPAELGRIRGYYNGTFTLSVPATDENIVELVELVDTQPAQDRSAYTGHLSIRWMDSEPMIDALLAFAEAAPSAKVHVSQDWDHTADGVSLGWSDDATPSDQSAFIDELHPEMAAAIDVWAAQQVQFKIVFAVDDLYALEMVNDQCPTDLQPLNLEYWEHATRPGHSVVWAPTDC